MAIPKNVATIAVLITLTASGCTQPDPNAKPTYTCTPSDGGTPHPCYKAEHELQANEDKLYAEAEAVYREYLAEEERINRTGGVDQPTPVLLATTTSPYLESAVESFAEIKAAHATAVGGKFQLVWVKRAPRDVRDGSVATLQMCLDASSVMMGSAGKRALPGGVSQRTAYFVRVGDRLVIKSGRYEWVEKC